MHILSFKRGRDRCMSRRKSRRSSGGLVWRDATDAGTLGIWKGSVLG